MPQAIDVMHKRHRLRANTDFQRLRREGQTLAHPLMVLSYLPNETNQSRFGFAVGVKIGKATRRNRIKRRMREAVRLRLQKNEVAAGWDVVFIAAMSGRGGMEPSTDEAQQPLTMMVESIRLGHIANYLPLDTSGNAVSLG